MRKLDIMDKAFQAPIWEQKLIAFWEQNDYFNARVNKDKEPFCIVLPPPNANGSLHLGHAMFVYEDVMIRFAKMQGKEVLWVLGLDHAGFETQYVFEKQLKKQGKSRFDYKREELFKMIFDYVNENKKNIKGQLKRLGYALDWKREKYTMDPKIIDIVYQTFEKLYENGLVYRANRLINYCTNCGTSFSDLEVADKEVEGLLYHVNYPLVGGGHIEIATTRPETLLGDVAVMVHPKDPRYKNLIGQKAVLPISAREIPIIADEYVDRKFGTGAVKVTPYHDFNDFEIGKKHNLSFPPIISFWGKIQNTNTHYDGLRIGKAREQIVQELKEKGLFVKQVQHKMVLKTCYKCGRTLEPLPKEQWFVKTRPLADEAKKLVKTGEVHIYPKRFEKQLLMILDNFIDWNISRQCVWGIQIPAYQCEEMLNDTCRKALGWFVSKQTPTKCLNCGSTHFKQDEDTFDTWFSSSQWPFATLKAESEEFYRYFYPTTVLETGYDILRAWVARMLMMGKFVTHTTPFHNVFLHGMVRDNKGQKMSKSKGNVMDPLLLVDKYGADALRAALIFGTKEGGDVALSEEKVKGMRNFANKIWNIGRFLYLNPKSETPNPKQNLNAKNAIIKELQREHKELRKKYLKNMGKYRFSQVLGDIHEFIWHRFADYYIEQLKEEMRNGNIEVLDVLSQVFMQLLQMVHPFMPFVSDGVYQTITQNNKSLLEKQI